MAVKTLTLYADQMVSYRRISENGAVSYEKHAGRGRAGGTDDGSKSAYEWRVLCDFSREWTDDITADSIRSVRLKLSGAGSSANIDVAEIKAYAWYGTSAGNTDAEIGWTAAKLGELIGEAEFYKGTSTVAQMNVGAAALSSLAEWKTVGLAPTYEPDPGDDDTYLAEFTQAVLEIEYISASAPPVIGNLTVSSSASAAGMISYTDAITLAWTYAQDAGAAQARIDVQMKTEQGDWEYAAEKYATSAQSYAVSPSSFPAPYDRANGVYIRVRAYSAAGAVSDWATAAAVMICPEAAELSPGGGSVALGDSASTLRWSVKCRYNGTDIPMKTPPTEYDIQYSTNGGDTWKTLAENFTASAEGGKYYRTVYANTFPVGPVQWRVRPRLAGNPGAVWAQESFIVRVQAATSSVSCDGKPHPTVSWSSASQIAYQVRFADYDSGAVYGSATSHTIPFVYGSGVYPVQVRTQASGGEWSAWTETEYVTITNTAPAGLVELYADKTARAASLRWMIDGPADAFIVYRNDVPVYVGLARSFEDAGACGECRYYVRAVSGGNYIQSNTVVLDVIPARDCMYDTNGGRWIDLRYSTSPRSRGYTETAGVVYKYYAGRKRPVAYLDGTIDRQLTVPYAFKTKAEADLAKSALGHTVIYKDTRGNRLVGILGSVNESVQSRRILHTLTFVEVDYNEEVRYED